MKSLLRFTCYCTVIASLASCTSFFKFMHNRPATAPEETSWSAKILQDSSSHEIESLTLCFSPTGKVVAKCSSGEINGYWHEDEVFNTFVMCFEPRPGLCELNKSWNVQLSGSAQVILKSMDYAGALTLSFR